MYCLDTNGPLILFEQSMNSEIYIDKSLLIDRISPKIRTGNKYLCVTRPRRFGKTVNANMLAAYYTKSFDSHELFDQLAIAGTKNYQTHLNRYHVIHMDLSRRPDPCDSYQDYIRYVKFQLTQDLEQVYGLRAPEGIPIHDILMETGDTFVFILDEWDSAFYETFMGQKEKIHYLKFLKGLLKDQSYVDLAYMTGVLPIAKYSSGSELNMFEEYSFIDDNVYDRYFGFTGDEVKALCQKTQSVSYEELADWYDGYRTSNGESLFNPRSVINALARGVCLNYWTETGPMNEVASCIEHNANEVREDVVQMVAGNPVRIRLEGYSASQEQMTTRNEILSAMAVYGFLSYHEGELRIPNRELMEKYEKVLTRASMGEVNAIVEQSKEILKATLNEDEENVAAMLEEVHDREIPFLNYKDENSLSCVITLCYLAARDDYHVEREAKSGKGYCDYLFLPRRPELPAIILELKVGSTAEEAVQQIKRKNYSQKAKMCSEILLVGISYDKHKHHTCQIERILNV